MQWQEYAISGLTSAVAILYIFFMSDEWHIGRGARAAYAVAATALWVSLAYLLPLPPLLRLLIVWPVVLLPLVFFSRARDARFVFILLTGMVFSYLNVVLSALLSYYWGLHRLPVRLVLDLCGLLLCRHIRPMFHHVFHAVREGWLICLLLPLSIAVSCFSFWDYWYFPARMADPSVQSYAFVLTLVTPLTYVVLFHFISEQQQRRDAALLHTLLKAQCDAMLWQAERHERLSLSGKILRHDLRHYLPLLTACIDEGREVDARALLAQMRQLLRGGAQQEDSLPATGEPMLDVVLQYFTKEAEQQRVPLILCLSLPPSLPFSPLVLAAFFSLTLGGALQGCTAPDAPPWRCIEVFSAETPTAFSLCVAYPYLGAPPRDAVSHFSSMGQSPNGIPYDAILHLLAKNGAALRLFPRDGWLEFRLLAKEAKP